MVFLSLFRYDETVPQLGYDHCPPELVQFINIATIRRYVVQVVTVSHNKKGKVIPVQAVEALRVVRRQGSHIF
jgi:hypothetical protein